MLPADRSFAHKGEHNMPNLITHCYFGDLVLQDLNNNDQEHIKANLQLFYMGTNGPDLFFSFRELNFGIPELSNAMQFVKAYEVFSAAAEYINLHPEDKAARVYFLGLFCHY